MASTTEPSGITKRLRAFGFAFRGLGRMFRSEVHARIHLAVTILVVATGLVLDLTRIEWAILTLTIAAVIALEAFNTAFEALCDVASPEHHPAVELAKDVAAGAVLVAAIASLVIAALIFGPYLGDLLAA